MFRSSSAMRRLTVVSRRSLLPTPVAVRCPATLPVRWVSHFHTSVFSAKSRPRSKKQYAWEKAKAAQTAAAADTASGGSTGGGSASGSGSGSSSDNNGNTEHDDDKVPSGMVARVKFLYRRYKYIALPVYASLYVGPFLVSYAAFSMNDNFGLDLLEVLGKVGLESTAASVFGITPSTPLNPKYVSLGFAWVIAEVLEPVRLPSTLLISKAVRNVLDNRKKQNNDKQQEQQEQDTKK